MQYLALEGSGNTSLTSSKGFRPLCCLTILGWIGFAVALVFMLVPETTTPATTPTSSCEVPPSPLQADINTFFKNYPPLPSHPVYKAYNPVHCQKMHQLLADITDKPVEQVLQFLRLEYGNRNPYELKHALAVYLAHSPDAKAKGVGVPGLRFHYPYSTMSSHSSVTGATTSRLTTQTTSSDSVQNLVALSNGTLLYPSPYQTQPAFRLVAKDLNTEDDWLSYWREDYDFNDFHLYWHILYPGNGIFVDGTSQRVIDRQGELFMYTHSQFLTRYDAERLSLGLDYTMAWDTFDEIYPYAYIPSPSMIDSYGGRPPNSTFFDFHNPNIPDDVPDAPPNKTTLQFWRDNVQAAISARKFQTVFPDGTHGELILTPETVQNWVGIVVESESDALWQLGNGEMIDRSLYGNLHNFGHDKFAEIGYHNFLTATNPYGLMGTNFGSARDPIFFPWHRHIQSYRLLAGKAFPQAVGTSAPNARLVSLSISSTSGASTLLTYLSPPNQDLSESGGKISHAPFQWNITIQSDQSPTPANPQPVTVRLFIVPTQSLDDDIYRHWIDMDKFTVYLTSSYTNIIRLDEESVAARAVDDRCTVAEDTASPWIHCGYPQAFLLPTGSPTGMSFTTFGMITDDIIPLDSLSTPSHMFCGNRNGTYPDTRIIGYPFNSQWIELNSTNTKDAFNKYISVSPHMRTSSFTIQSSSKPYVGTSVPETYRNVTWENRISKFFTGRDVWCMRSEYGYDFTSKDDVILHAAVIYGSTSAKRMPLQMPPYTQLNPDPNYPLWSDEMLSDFNWWMHNGYP